MDSMDVIMGGLPGVLGSLACHWSSNAVKGEMLTEH